MGGGSKSATCAAEPGTNAVRAATRVPWPAGTRANRIVGVVTGVAARILGSSRGGHNSDRKKS